MENTKITLESLNKGGLSEFVGALGDVFENCPWLVARTSSARPFHTKEALIAALLDEMKALSREEKLQLLRAHPDLAGKAARTGKLTKHSTREQKSAGLDQLSKNEFFRFERLNKAYQKRFGFPFIIAVSDHSKESIFSSFETRLGSSQNVQIEEALKNIGRIVSLRIKDVMEK